MINDYKRAMDKIKTDDEYKAKFIASLQEKQNSSSKARKQIRFLPAISYMTTAAAVLLVVYCTAIFFVKQPDDAKMRMRSESAYTYNDVSSVVYFTFDGFEKYNVQVESRAVLFGGFKENYTIANLLNDYYPVIVGENGNVEINDGMVDNFLNVTADSKKEINVYVNDRELLNLEKELVSECLQGEDVYFKVSVEE